MSSMTPRNELSALADESQVLLAAEIEHLSAVRDWLQRIITVQTDREVALAIPRLEELARAVGEKRRRFRQSLGRALRLPPAECGMGALLERLPAERRASLATARSHALWLANQVGRLTRLARMQANDLANCLGLLLSSGSGPSPVVERYDGRGLRTQSHRATLLNDRC